MLPAAAEVVAREPGLEHLDALVKRPRRSSLLRAVENANIVRGKVGRVASTHAVERVVHVTGSAALPKPGQFLGLVQLVDDRAQCRDELGLFWNFFFPESRSKEGRSERAVFRFGSSSSLMGEEREKKKKQRQTPASLALTMFTANS